MIDIHTHVLPEIDDGSRSVEESLMMLRASAQQGITHMAATPHFYPMEHTPEQFLARRAVAAEQLRSAWEPGLPELLLGAEVYFFEGMSTSEELGQLCLEGTDLLLVEMPFCPWTERVITELMALQRQAGCKVLLAHIERYFSFAPRDIWDVLLEEGILMQCNASFFLSWKTKRRACRMLREGKIHFLGSDSHNMSSRPPQLGKALAVIGETGRQIVERNVRDLLPAVEGEVH